MQLPEYVSRAEVKRVCQQLGLRDWSAIKDDVVGEEEAAIILNAVNTNGMAIPLQEFWHGLVVELEHGTRFEDANVTNNHPLLTGRIVLAHLKETMDYYERLEVAEIEGDLLEAVLAGDLTKIRSKYAKLAEANITLNQVIKKQS